MFYLHALYILSADNSGRFPQNPKEVTHKGADNNQRACESKIKPSKRLETLPSSDFLRNPEKGGFARGVLRKFAANCAPNLRKIAGISFRTSEAGAQNCRELVANLKLSVNFGQIYANKPFPTFSKFMTFFRGGQTCNN